MPVGNGNMELWGYRSASEKGLLVSCAAFAAGAGLGCVPLSHFLELL